MAIASGIGAQIGIKAESVYGTPVTVDRFYEFESEAIDIDIAQIDGPQVGAGRFLRNDRVKPVLRGARGPISMIVLNKSMGLWFKNLLGSDTVSGASANKTQTIIPDSLALQGQSLSLQVGRPDIGGVVRAFSFEGGKILDAEFKCALDEPLRVTFNMDFENVLTATGLATASYVATQEMFVATEAALTIGGTTTAVKAATIKVDNKLAGDRRFLGNTKKEPLAMALMEVSGSLDAEFEDLTAYAAWLAGTQAQLILTFTVATVIPSTAVPYSFKITLPKIAYLGDTPKVGGPDVVMQNKPFRALYDGTNPIITIEIVSSDTAA